MYGDTEQMRRRAGQLREQAVDLRSMADQLVTRTESIGWSGRAAESMRVRVAERATHLRAAAGRHDGAADALDKHLQVVGDLQETIAGTERKATGLVADAVTRLAALRAADEADAESGVRHLPDPDDQQLAAFEPPPSGHRDWLEVELPGL